jgi:hypothetical protein
MRMPVFGFLAAAALLLGGAAASADDAAGMFKVVRGSVTVQRHGGAVPAQVGMPVYQSDRIITGDDGSAGISFHDNTLLSLGPSSQLDLDSFSFNPTTHEGQFVTSLNSGRLAVVSGKIAHEREDAMTVRTPDTVLGVRGTKFLVQVGSGS